MRQDFTAVSGHTDLLITYCKRRTCYIVTVHITPLCVKCHFTEATTNTSLLPALICHHTTALKVRTNIMSGFVEAHTRNTDLLCGCGTYCGAFPL